MPKIGKYIPSAIKKHLIQLTYLPERIGYRIYYLSSRGKIFVPDKIHQNWDYYLFTKRSINFKNPQTYQDKLQWLKYYYHKPIMTKLVDKYEVREYVKEKIGEEYLIPLYGVYDTFDEIDFNSIPNQFVLKCTHDSGSVVICKDKNTFDIQAAKKKLEERLKLKQFYISREWPYKNVKPRIICEKYLENINDGINDFKFLCFDGEVKLLYAIKDILALDEQEINFYYPNWERIEMKGRYRNINEKVSKPDCLEEMIDCAEKLSNGFPHLRVDFFICDGKPYFGEITFFNYGGRELFTPDKYNKILGDWITLPEKCR